MGNRSDLRAAQSEAGSSKCMSGWEADLDSIHDWEIRGGRLSRHIGIAAAIHRDAKRLIVCASAQISRVNQLGGVRIQLRHKCGLPSNRRLPHRLERSAGSGEIRGVRASADIGIAGLVYSQTAHGLRTRAAEVSHVKQAVSVGAYLEGNRIGAALARTLRLNHP